MALTAPALLAFLTDELALGPDTGLDTLLFSSGAIDSVGMLGLIAFVEEATGEQVRPDLVTLENFDTPARILRLAGEITA